MNLNLSEKIDMLPSLRTTVEAHGLLAKKALGQNFLLDRNITGKIIRLSLNAQNLSDYRGAAVYEVGPGPGGLTREILRAEPDKLIVVEMDERCIAIMEEIKAKVGERLQIVNGDALKQNFAEFKQTPRHIVSNLPYNISVPLLVGWLKEMENFASLTLMFQKKSPIALWRRSAAKTMAAYPFCPSCFAKLKNSLISIPSVSYPHRKSGLRFSSSRRFAADFPPKTSPASKS